MNRTSFQATVVSFFILTISSCSLVNSHTRVAIGNYEFSKGNYAQANYSYQTAQNKQYCGEYIAYNLGNVYLALGEQKAALNTWETADTATNHELQFRISFNRGVLFYNLGKYESAFEEFKKALKIKPSNIPAKMNLEICYEKKSSSSAPSSNQGGGDTLTSIKNMDADRTLELIRKKEEQLWNSSSLKNSGRQENDW